MEYASQRGDSDPKDRLSPSLDHSHLLVQDSIVNSQINKSIPNSDKKLMN